MIIQINLFLFPKKRRLYDRKKTRLHSKKSKRLKRTAALEAKDPNSYIPIYSPKRLRRMGQQGERTHYPTRWCVNEPDAWFSSQRTVVRANKKQTYLKGGRELGNYVYTIAKQPRRRLTQLYLHSPNFKHILNWITRTAYITIMPKILKHILQYRYWYCN